MTLSRSSRRMARSAQAVWAMASADRGASSMAAISPK